MRSFRLFGSILLAAIIVFLSIGYLLTYRYPSLRFDPIPITTELATPAVQINAQGAYVKNSADALYRAYSPDASFTINASSTASLTLKIENIHP